MSNTTPSGLERLLFVCAVAATIHGTARADDAWTERLPLQDTYVDSASSRQNIAYGDSEGIIIGGGREGCLMFDVSDLANVTAAKFRFYLSQCGSTSGAKWPVYFQIMRNDRWNENTLTWNSLPDEFRTMPAAVVATNDATIAGTVVIPAGSTGTWQEVDLTEAVKAAAARTGRLALHAVTMWDSGEGGDTTPLGLRTTDAADSSLHPKLMFQGATTANPDTLTIVASADTHVQSGGSANTNFGSKNDAVMVDCNGRREAFIKFDLSNVSAPAVDSAVFLLHTYPSTSGDHAYTSDDGIQFELTGKTDWNETTLTWNNAQEQTGTAVNRSWESETPSTAVRGPSSAANRSYTVDVTTLVNQVLAAGGDTLSLHIWRNPSDSKRYFFICPREYAKEEHRPRLLITPRVDAALTTRKPVQETFVGNGSTSATNTYYNGRWTNIVQIGCSGSSVQYATMLFDVNGLDDAPFVRFRVKNNNTISGGDGALRVAAWTTGRWNETNFTWNTAKPTFPQPAAITAATPIDGEVASFRLEQNKSAKRYFEADVTAAARAAAAEGKMLTLGLFSNKAWHNFYKGADAASPAELVFPNPDARFGARVVASLDMSGEKPALRLTWSPADKSGATYTVRRRDGEGWASIASGISEATCLDATAEPKVEYEYEITATLPNASTASVTKAVTLDAQMTLFACADTFVQNGNKGGTKYGTEASIVEKYDSNEGTGGVREGLIRFDLSHVPARISSATLHLTVTGDDEDCVSGSRLDVLKYPDREWTDENAPTWNDMFGNQWATPLARGSHPDPVRETEPLLGTYTISGTDRFTAGKDIAFDISAAVRAALAANETHLTLHTATWNSNNNWNFGFVTRERAQGPSLAPRIEFVLKTWVRKGTTIRIR